MMRVMLRLLCERRARNQNQHQHQRAPDFSMTHVNALKPHYLYPVRLPDELIQIKMVVDLPHINRGR